MAGIKDPLRMAKKKDSLPFIHTKMELDLKDLMSRENAKGLELFMIKMGTSYLRGSLAEDYLMEKVLYSAMEHK